MPSMKFHEDENGCHVWDAAVNSRGYGVVWFEGKVHLAHRVAWFLEHGRWPTEGLVLDHLCDVKRCVNAAHLRELTNSANIRRAYPRGDEQVERKRAGWRAANARRRGNYRYVDGGESDSVVQGR